MNARKKFLPIFIFGFSLTLTRCTNTTEQVYFPLEEGLAWRYQFDRKSNWVLHSGQGNVNVTISGQREIHGKTTMIQKIDVSGQSSFTFLVEDTTGIYEFARQSSTDMEPQLKSYPNYLIKYPITLDETWKTIQKSSIDDGVLINCMTFVESIDDLVTVPAGTFEQCVKIKSFGKTSRQKRIAFSIVTEEYSLELTDWYAKGVGLVKTIANESLNKTQVETALQLEEYSR